MGEPGPINRVGPRILDLGIICELARKKLEKDDSPIILATQYYNQEITPSALKEKVKADVHTYLLSRF